MSQEIMSSLGAEGFTLLAHHVFVSGIAFGIVLVLFIAFMLYKLYVDIPEGYKRIIYYAIIAALVIGLAQCAVMSIDPEGTVLTSMVLKSK